jgi:hypothetical protein
MTKNYPVYSVSSVVKILLFSDRAEQCIEI